jgi:hypothetical protein
MRFEGLIQELYRSLEIYLANLNDRFAALSLAFGHDQDQVEQAVQTISATIGDRNVLLWAQELFQHLLSVWDPNDALGMAGLWPADGHLYEDEHLRRIFTQLPRPQAPFGQ